MTTLPVSLVGVPAGVHARVTGIAASGSKRRHTPQPLRIQCLFVTLDVTVIAIEFGRPLLPPAMTL